MLEETSMVAVDWWEVVNAGSVLRNLLKGFTDGFDVWCERMKSRMIPIFLV